MAQLFNIQDDKVIINKLALRFLEGPVIHTGSLDIVGNTNMQANLTVAGSISADTINVKNLVTDSGSLANVGQWFANTEEELNGKGFNWTHGTGTANLVYRTGNRLWSTSNIDLDTGLAYRIGNAEVINATGLGPTIKKSNLTEIGSLKSLNVIGNTTLAEFAVFDSGFARLGLNIDEPNAVLSIGENDVEIVLGAPRPGAAEIGTYTNHDVSIITDNTVRFTVKNDGSIVVGNEFSKTGSVTIHGTLTVDTLVTDTRVERTAPLEFKATRDTAIYGRGLVWTGTGVTRQFIMMADPDRLYSSESIDLGADQSYHVNKKAVLSETSLGDSVINSKLTSVGPLKNLEVSGETKLYGNLNASFGNTLLKNAVFNDGVNSLSINSSSVNVHKLISVKVSEDEAFYADLSEIAIGNKNNTRRPVKIYGPVSVGVTNPDPTVDFTVKGNVSFADKKFITGSSAPSEGTFSKGDVCWNNNPRNDSFIGWVCVQDGTPGEWLPFGMIGR